MNQEDPYKLNLKEVMGYYGLKGPLGKLKYILKFLKVWIIERLMTIAITPQIRARLQRMKGVKIGKYVYIGEGVMIDQLYPREVEIGDFAEIGDRTLIYAHTRGSLPLKRLYPREVKSVKIGKGVWIGNGVIILPGVKIGDNSIIGAGAVVTKNIPSAVVATGVPAQVIKKLNI